MKSIVLLSLYLVSFSALADDYTYRVTTGYDAGAKDYVTTNCDHCTLTSANIIGWSLSQTFNSGLPAPPFTSSSLVQSSVLVQGGGFVATPTGLLFDFTIGDPYDNVVFTSGANYVQLSNLQDGLSVRAGSLQYCGPSVCYASSYNSDQQLGTRIPQAAAPELDPSGIGSALTMLFGCLAVLSGRVRGEERRSGQAAVARRIDNANTAKQPRQAPSALSRAPAKAAPNTGPTIGTQL